MLLNCVVYRDGHKLAEIPKEDISEYVVQPDCLIWVALHDATPAELAEIAEEFGLHPLAVEDARKGHQRPKIEEFDDSLFAVLKTVESISEGDESGDAYLIGEVDIFVGRNYVLSVRHHTQKGFADVRARCEREPELLRHGSGFVFYALMDAVVDRYFPILDELEEALQEAEDRMFDSASSRAKIEDLYALKRRLMVLRHAVTPLLEAVGKLTGGRVPVVCTGLVDYFRDVYDHLSRIQAVIDGMREMLQTAVQVNLALINLSDSEVTKRLAAWGALITVPTLIAGIYGMNFQHMPELNWVIGYPAALVLMFGVDTVLYFKFRQAKWL
jgi:magnesium transporter